MSEKSKGNGRGRFISKCVLVRAKNPRTGKLVDIYGIGSPIPEWFALDEAQVKHFLEHGLVEVADDNWQPADPGRVIECLSAIISAGAEPGMGRPRVAELVRSAGFHHSNEALGKALKLFNGGWKLGESMDPYLA